MIDSDTRVPLVKVNTLFVFTIATTEFVRASVNKYLPGMRQLQGRVVLSGEQE